MCLIQGRNRLVYIQFGATEMLFNVSIDGGLVIQRRQFLQCGIARTVFFGGQNIDAGPPTGPNGVCVWPMGMAAAYLRQGAVRMTKPLCISLSLAFSVRRTQLFCLIARSKAASDFLSKPK